MIFKISSHDKPGERGNILALIFAGIGLLGLVSLGTFNILSGPVESMFRLNETTVADAQMLAVSRVIIGHAPLRTSAGDCDNDLYIEAPEWRDTAGIKPANGGVLPIDLGVPLTDPYGNEYGYCVWDVGPDNVVGDTPACDDDGDASYNRLSGTPDPRDATEQAHTKLVFAIISPGRDDAYTTTCNAYTDGTTPLITTSGDDIVKQYTYAEAEELSRGLWSIKAGDQDAAEITKNLEINPVSGALSSQATIGTDTGLGLEAVANFIATKTNNLYDRSGNGIDLEDDVRLIQNGGTDHRFRGIFMVKAKSVPDTLQTAGTGKRFFFYPKKGALRAGEITDADGAGGLDTDTTEWDDANIGDYSAAFGRNTLASGEGSFAMGGDLACASSLCSGGRATGKGAAAFGISSDSASIGGKGALGIGINNDVSGDYSVAIGANSIVSGSYSGAFGRMTVTADNAWGIGLTQGATDTLAQSNTMAIMRGSWGIRDLTPGTPLSVAGTIKIGNTSETCQDGREGMVRYNATSDEIELCEDNAGTEQWIPITGSGGADDADWVISGGDIYYNNPVHIGGNTAVTPDMVVGSGGTVQFARNTGAGTLGAYTTAAARVVYQDVTSDSGIITLSAGGTPRDVIVLESAPAGSIKVRDYSNFSDDVVVLDINVGDGRVMTYSPAAANEIHRLDTSSNHGQWRIWDPAGGGNMAVQIYANGGNGQVDLSVSGGAEVVLATSGDSYFGTAPGDNESLCIVESNGTDCAGDLHVQGNIEHTAGFTDVSDARLKKNIRPLGNKVPDLLKQLRPVSFSMKDDAGGRRQFGFIAQDVENIFPNLVKINKKTPEHLRYLNYLGLVAPLTAGVQGGIGNIRSLETGIVGLAEKNARIARETLQLEEERQALQTHLEKIQNMNSLLEGLVEQKKKMSDFRRRTWLRRAQSTPLVLGLFFSSFILVAGGGALACKRHKKT